MTDNSFSFTDSNSNSNGNSPFCNKKHRENYDQIRLNLKSTLFDLKHINSACEAENTDENQVMTLKKVEENDEISSQNLEERKQGIFYIKGNFRSFYREGKKLGEGCVGLVKKVQKISDNKIYAVKIVKIKDEESVLAIKKEFQNLKPLDHPNIVKVHELYIDNEQSQIYLIMDYIKAKEMFKVLKKHGSYSESLASIIFKQILQAIHYMHSKGICHRDLKPNNILCSSDGSEVKITDFNVSKFDKDSQKKDKFGFGREKIKMWTYTGTIAFSAPEIFQETEYNESVDMWSAGVVLYTMLCGYQPFQAEYVTDLINLIIAVKYEFNPDPWDQISKSAKDLISRCLTKNPKERISPIDALMHPWIAHKKASTNILPAKILENLHKNLKRLTRTKLFEKNIDENQKLKKRTLTENVQRHMFSPEIEEMKEIAIDEDKKEDSQEEIIEKRAISFLDGMGDFEIADFRKKRDDEKGYKFQTINEQIIQSLKEKDSEYNVFFEKLMNVHQ